MRSILAVLIVLFSFQTHAEISQQDVAGINCTAGNLAGVSNFTYNAETGILSAYTFSVLGPSIQNYEIGYVDASSKFGTTDVEFGKISFRSTNPANPMTYMMITNHPLSVGTGAYVATWGSAVAASPFGGPAGIIPIANLVCTIDIN